MYQCTPPHILSAWAAGQLPCCLTFTVSVLLLLADLGLVELTAVPAGVITAGLTSGIKHQQLRHMSLSG